MEDRATGRLCGAKTRAGTPCRRASMRNGRCHLHGGKSLSGLDSPRRTHGLYSKSRWGKDAAVAALLRAAGYRVETERERQIAQALLRRLGPRTLIRRFPPQLPPSEGIRSACELSRLAFPVDEAALWGKVLQRLRRKGLLRSFGLGKGSAA